MSALTIRSWCIGMLLAGLIGAVNTFFSFREPAPYISPFILLIIAYPIGKICAAVVPYSIWTMPRCLGGFTIDWNPGPFNIKEHTVIIMTSSVGISPAYGLLATVTSEKWYHRDLGAGFACLFILSTQLTGFAFAGMCRRFVIYPASMIWPAVVSLTTNMNTLHAEDDVLRGGMNRSRFMTICIGAAFAWHFLPG